MTQSTKSPQQSDLSPEPIHKSIAFLGTGNMGEAILNGLLAGGAAAPGEICISHPRSERCEALHERYGVRAVTDNAQAVKQAEIVLLCVKPQILLGLIDALGDALPKQALVISIAAGVPLSAIEAHLPKGCRCIRVMPNTPCLVGAGASAIAPGPHATHEDQQLADRIFSSVGISVHLDENQLDAATGLSGSGPAYIFLMIEALADGGVKMGLSRARALRLAAQTVYGSAKLLIETGEHPGRLKDQVTSPGGTAIVGIHTLEKGGLRRTLMDAVEAATLRARELGQLFRS